MNERVKRDLEQLVIRIHRSEQKLEEAKLRLRIAEQKRSAASQDFTRLLNLYFSLTGKPFNTDSKSPAMDSPIKAPVHQ